MTEILVGWCSIMAAAQPARDGTISNHARKIKANQRKHWTGAVPKARFRTTTG
jgi:hypothetical protein